MKKIYSKIEIVNIEGGPGRLNELVTDIDNIMQEITQGTWNMSNDLRQYASMSDGEQFNRLLQCFSDFWRKMYLNSSEINELQKSIVDYQRKLCRFEDSDSICEYNPTRFICEPPKFSDVARLHLDVGNMNKMVSALQIYENEVFLRKSEIQRKKENIGRIWKDPQYNAFSKFIDEITGEIDKSLKQLRKSREYFQTKLKELNG